MTVRTATFEQLISDPVAFRQGIRIATDDGPRPLSEVIDAWQEDDFRALDNGLRKIAGLPVDPSQQTYLRAWLERPRGHSKSLDTAVRCSFLLLACRHKATGVAAAGKRERQVPNSHPLIFKQQPRANGGHGE